jgi:hypothetical protein
LLLLLQLLWLADRQWWCLRQGLPHLLLLLVLLLLNIMLLQRRRLRLQLCYWINRQLVLAMMSWMVLGARGVQTLVPGLQGQRLVVGICSVQVQCSISQRWWGVSEIERCVATVAPIVVS